MSTSKKIAYTIPNSKIAGLSLDRLLTGLFLLVLASFFMALTSGSLDIHLTDIIKLLQGEGNPMYRQVVLELRFPRAVSGLAVGGLLALSGALMQILLRNPLADPYILGLSGGAACGAIVAMIAGLGVVWIEGAALFGALLTMVMVFHLSHEQGSWSSSRLLLTGVVVASGWGAMVSFLLVSAPNAQLKNILFWLMGDLTHAQHPNGALIVLILGFLIVWPFSRSLNLLARGELQAASLGVRVDLLRVIIFLVASLLTAVAVTTAGSIGFVGLVVPHLLRLIGCSDHRFLLPAAVLLGSTLLILADTLSRTVVAPQQIPVGVVTALIGVPIFLFLLSRGRV